MTSNDFDVGSAPYTAGEPFQRERQMVFARSWLPFAASAQLPRPGDYVSHSLGGWPLFAIRGEDGVARAFHNRCRHQGMPVVERPAGSCEALRCRYHGWTYGLAGEFREAPPRVAPAEPAAQLGLEAVELAERDGFCLVRVRPGGGPPPRLAVAAGRFATAITTDIDANWKAVVEPLLAAADWHFVWPLAFVAEHRLGFAAVRQIVPRSFSRTRLVDLLFARDAVVAEAAAAAWRHGAATDKTAAEGCQARHAAGTPAEPSAAFAAFAARLAAACTATQP